MRNKNSGRCSHHGSQVERLPTRLQDTDDKSQFLAQAGFTRDEPEFLEAAIRNLIENEEMVLDRTDEYGTFYEVSGDLTGSHDRKLAVTTIWMEETATGDFKFITLIPQKRK